MSKTYVTLSGGWISNIPEERRMLAAGIRSDDFFLISQPALSSVDPDRTYESGGRTYTSEYRSANIPYEGLLRNVIDDLTPGFGFKDMAWELSDRYSLAGHVHNYSTMSAVPSPVAGEVSVLGVFSVNTKKVPIRMAQVRIYDSSRPYIGQLKFMALSSGLPTMPNSDSYYDSAGFSGWVYPDGRELNKQRFPDAYAAFGDLYGAAAAGKFKIPNLTEFVKPYFPASTTAQLTGTVAAQDVLLAHAHDIQRIGLSGSAKGTLSVAAVGDNTWVKPETAAQHGGTGKPTMQYVFNAAFTCENLKCDQANLSGAYDGSETYPSHTEVPVMIYVGGV